MAAFVDEAKDDFNVVLAEPGGGGFVLEFVAPDEALFSGEGGLGEVAELVGRDIGVSAFTADITFGAAVDWSITNDGDAGEVEGAGEKVGDVMEASAGAG